jgi:hypothetical protein
MRVYFRNNLLAGKACTDEVTEGKRVVDVSLIVVDLCGLDPKACLVVPLSSLWKSTPLAQVRTSAGTCDALVPISCK